MHFARVLRRAGLPVGPGHVLDAVEAVQTAGIGQRADFYWTLHAVFVKSRHQRELFDQAFHVFWRKPGFLEQMMATMLPDEIMPPEDRKKRAGEARLSEAMFGGAEVGKREVPDSEVLELEASMTFSAREILRGKDFEQMSVEEQAEAKAALARFRFSRAQLRTRRWRPDPAGWRADLRATMRASLRHGGRLLDLKYKRRQSRPPPLVVLCDISGSMTNYSRMFLHFLHALTNDRGPGAFFSVRHPPDQHFALS